MISTSSLDKLTKLFSRSGNYFAVIYFLCSGVGAFYSVFYLFHGLYGIAAYEFFTFAIYLPVLYMARIDHPATGPVAYLQFVHHQVFSTYMFGFYSGFWLLLCCMYFAHFIFFSRTWAQIGTTVLTTALVFGYYGAQLYGILPLFSPTIAAREHLVNDLFLINLGFATGFMIVSGLVIHISSNGRIDSLMNLVYKDFLTGLYNRKYVLECIWPKASKEPLCIAVADIDNFKQINDTKGHEQGDVVLKFLALLMQKAGAKNEAMRANFARWGGEEFVILAQTDDHAGFLRLIDGIRTELANSDIFGNEERVSVSIGAVAKAEQLGFKAAFEQADKNLYVAKRTGKNTVVM